MPLSNLHRLQYFVQAAAGSVLGRDRRCPGCDSAQTRLVRRKYLVSSLWLCDACGLRFRIPKDDAAETAEFYQDTYSEGFATDCPSAQELALLLARNFAGSERDFRTYIDVVKAAGLAAGSSILDFGSSWGYGSWQFRQAGFRVFSYEISRPRAEFARRKLSCEMVDDLATVRRSVDCLFSAHVIEHLPNPGLIWDAANRVLVDDGLLVCFCPNGEPAREALVSARTYNSIWGKVHPMLITPEYLRRACQRYGFRPQVYSSPYRIADIAAGKVEREVTGDELCMIARKTRRASSPVVRETNTPGENPR